MLTYDLKQDKIPKYLQLYEKIKKDILDSKILPNEKLPSKRKFANHLGLGLITIENAYEQLAAEGYIYSIEKKGYFVSQIIENNFKYIKIKKKVREISTEVESKKIYDLKSLDVDSSLFPFSIWSKLMRQVISFQDKKLLVKINSFGIYDLRLAISKHLFSYQGLDVDPSQIIIGAGSEYLYSMIIKLLGFDKIIALENPGYKKIAKIYLSNNVKVNYVDLDSDGIDVTKLENSDIVHISPAHQFPTGIVMPINRRLDLIRWANEKEGRYIIEDDYDSEFRFRGTIVPSMMSIEKSEKVIYMNTFSKTIAPSIRISYMVIPKTLVSIYKQKLGFFSCAVPSFEQYTLAKFIEEGYYERHLSRMKNFYKKKRDLIIKLLKQSKLNKIAKLYQFDSGLHFLLKIKTNLSDEILINKALEEGVKLTCLSQYFYLEKKEEHVIIVNYSSISDEGLEKVINILEKILC